MELKKVTAIIDTDVLEKVENSLQKIGVTGISVTYVKGFGQYANFFKSPPLVSHARIEIFADEYTVHSIVDAIMQTAHTGLPGDGIIAVLPVERLYRISEMKEITTSELSNIITRKNHD
jgi:nitrogen regulatory protein P-II 1